MAIIRVAFFDIGDTLGVMRFAPSGQPVSLEVFPYVRDVVARLKQDGLRLGVISNTGTIPGQTIRPLLDAAGLAFEPGLLLFSADLGVTKASPEIFARAAQIAGAAPGECMYVGEDAKERATAATAGMAACPHPLLAADVAGGSALSFAVVTAPSEPPERWRQLLRQAGALPLHLAGRGGRTVYAILSTPAARVLVDAQLDVHRLGAVNLPLRSDLYLVRDDVSARSGFLQPYGQSSELFDSGDTADWLLSASADGLVLAVPAGESIERVHFTSALHGHTLRLRPDSNLLELDARAAATAMPESFAVTLQPPALNDAESAVLRDVVSADAVRTLVARYAGAEPLGDDHNPPNIVSRHVHRMPDNERAVLAATAELGAIPGIGAVLHAFDHEGMRLFNVEASLPGTRDEWVLVTAHLDSTAASDRPYNPATDKAPGADDDASGMAGVITAARAIAALAATRRPSRGVRFVLFNAEEHGLVGSKAYAREQAARGAAITAVLQMDMVGFNRQPPRTFEIHAGFARSAAVEDRSLQLASFLAQVAATVSPELAAAQIYPAAAGGRDEADGRSDHSAFQEVGYSACVACEDLFIGPLPDSPEPEGNPQYHRKADTFVDERYAANIARAVAAAAWLSAR
jgi:bacterial leucyl aminopeptidase